MLTQESFIKRIKQPNSPSWLHVGVDTQDEKQLYIAVNGGMNNINCAPIENYLSEIKSCALELIDEGHLYLKPMLNHFVSAKGEVFISILYK